MPLLLKKFRRCDVLIIAFATLLVIVLKIMLPK